MSGRLEGGAMSQHRRWMTRLFGSPMWALPRQVGLVARGDIKCLTCAVDVFASQISTLMDGIRWLQERQFEPLPEASRTFSHSTRAAVLQAQQRIPTMIFEHQLLALFYERPTGVAREVERLVQARELRRVLIGDGEVGLVPMQEYIQLVEAAGLPSTLSARFRAFVSGDDSPAQTEYFVPRVLVGDYFTRDELRSLVSTGLLTIPSHEYYAVAVVGMGRFTRAAHTSRLDVMRFLARQRYKEALESRVRDRKVKYAYVPSSGETEAAVAAVEARLCFGWAYRLCDLVGSGRVETFMTPVGRGLRATRKGLQLTKK